MPTTAGARRSRGTPGYLNRYTAPANDLTAPAPAAADPARVVTSVFDRVGNPVSQTGADGGKQDFVYSSTRKLIRQTTSGNNVAADVARTSNNAPRVLTFEYDSADRLVKFTNVDGVIETYSYDSANNKIAETITNPNLLAGGRTDPVRTTRFEYDLDNRMTKQIFDPAGLQLTEQIGYDAFGNIVRRADANGNVSTIAYDLVNRETRVTDPLGGSIGYQYDRVGNRTAVTDARGNRTDLKYDRNGLLVEELKPAADMFTLAGGVVTGVRPKTTTQYDAAGNIVQIIDAAGNKTTRYYDGNDNLVAELNGDNALREYSYNATDDLVTATQYLTRLAASAHNPLLRPGTPAGEARTVTNEYDAGGRLTRIVYPSIEVTTLAGATTGAPTSTKANVVVTEVNRFDRFGNLVESLDRNGNRTVSYYDLRGRVIAAIDAGGYLTESDYDSQDHVVQQRQYATALTGYTPGTKPTAAGTPAAVVDRVLRHRQPAGRGDLAERAAAGRQRTDRHALHLRQGRQPDQPHPCGRDRRGGHRILLPRCQQAPVGDGRRRPRAGAVRLRRQRQQHAAQALLRSGVWPASRLRPRP